jgi:hypothetical protein
MAAIKCFLASFLASTFWIMQWLWQAPERRNDNDSKFREKNSREVCRTRGWNAATATN